MALTDFVPIGAPTTAEGPAGDSLSSVIPTVARLVRERAAARTQAADLARDNRRLEAFLSLAGHELRGPVMSSSLGVQFAVQRVDLLRHQAAQCDARLASQLSAVQDGLTTAASCLERLTRLVSDLLDLSRITSGQVGQLRGQPEPADLLTLVRTAVDEHRQLAPSRHIRLHQPPSRGEIRVWADADRLHQVLTNLLANALKYAPADRSVQVSVRVLKGWARVGVRDHGPGLPPEEHQRIWEAFHRADGIAVTGGTPHASAQSLGLGLYITKTIIEQHHGKAGIRSAPGKGSTFWFALPMMPVMAGVRTETEDDEARWPASDAT
jgi:signal transduction histidine kinase